MEDYRNDQVIRILENNSISMNRAKTQLKDLRRWKTSDSISYVASTAHQQGGTIAKDRDRSESRRVVVVIFPVILVIVDDASFSSRAARARTRLASRDQQDPRSQRSEIVFALRCRQLVTRSFLHLLVISARTYSLTRVYRRSPLSSYLCSESTRLSDFSNVFMLSWLSPFSMIVHRWPFVAKCASIDCRYSNGLFISSLF